MADVASDYFMNIFKASTCDRMEDCLNTVNQKITDDMMEVLSMPYSSENNVVLDGTNKGSWT